MKYSFFEPRFCNSPYIEEEIASEFKNIYLRKGKCHILKILPEYYRACLSCRKSFEVRKNDRNYCVGDFLALAEYIDGLYTGFYCYRMIGYILTSEDFPDGIMNGYCILGLERD